MVWINLVCSLYMTGLIFFVQIVHYPLFALTARKDFAAYAAAHTSRAVWVTAPVMLLELGASLLLLWEAPWGLEAVWLWGIAALTASVWASTFLLQVPQHEILSRGFDETAWRRLVRSNWIRTLLWSLKSALLIYIIVQKLH